MFEQGGIALSDSDMDSDSMRGSGSDMEQSTNPLNPNTARTQPKFSQPKYTQPPPPAQFFQEPPIDLKNRYNSVISMLEKQNAYLTQEAKRIQAASEAETHRIMSNNRMEVDRLLSEIKQIKTKMAYQDAQMPGIREALAQVRDMLSGLVPESVYLKLRDMNQSDMPLQEYILV